jgi:5-methylcytosine-specific restriction endonuclease McrA
MTYLHPSMRPKKGIRKSRSKPRPGRLKGADMEQMRRDCFERDRYQCQGHRPMWNWFTERWEPEKCLRYVTWENGHMAHIGAKRRHGDSLDNVRTLCGECHGIEHQWGKSMTKPCPRKEQPNG